MKNSRASIVLDRKVDKRSVATCDLQFTFYDENDNVYIFYVIIILHFELGLGIGIGIGIGLAF
jgi:hypothetical protein